MSDQLDEPWDNDVTIDDVDQFFRRLRDGSISSASPGIPEPYPIVGDPTPQPLFDHGYAGVLGYAIEPGLILLQQRGQETKWNPNKICIPGGRIREGESPSGAAIREFAEETGVIVPRESLRPLRAGIERRTPVAVFRAIHVVMLDRVPAELRPGEGIGIHLARITRALDLDQLTWLSREDLEIFLHNYHPRRAA